jgi:hypothetical protein
MSIIKCVGELDRRCYNLKKVTKAAMNARAELKTASSTRKPASGISAADMAKVRGIASARGCPRKAEFWIENQLGTAREFIAALAANDRRLHELFPGCALANMSGRSILTPEDAARLAKLGRDGEAIWREAEKRDAFGEALAFIRNGRSFREFRQYLANDRVIWHATRQPKRWGDPY